MEITEDAEEHNIGKDETKSMPPDMTERPASMMSTSTIVPSRVTSNVERPPSSSAESQVPNDDASEMVPATRSLTQPSSSSSRRNHYDLENPATSSLSGKSYLQDLSYERRGSSQRARPALRDLEHSYVPKVKRGPRPSVDLKGRPRTAGSMTRSQDQRPVASLPSTVRMSSGRQHSNHHTDFRPRSQADSAAVVPDRNAPPVPPLLLVPPPVMTGLPRPQVSSSTKSMSAVTTSGLTPEKERLMKALHLRRKQIEKQAELKKKQQNNNGAVKLNNKRAITSQDKGEVIQGKGPTPETQGERQMGEHQTATNSQQQQQQQQQHSAPVSVGPSEEMEPVISPPGTSGNNLSIDGTMAAAGLKGNSEFPIPPAPVPVPEPNDAIAHESPESLSSPTQDQSDTAPLGKGEDIAADPDKEDTKKEATPLADGKPTDGTPLEPRPEMIREKKDEESAPEPQTRIPTPPPAGEREEERKVDSYEQPPAEEKSSHEPQLHTPDKGSVNTETSPHEPTPDSSDVTQRDVDDGPQEKGGSGSERELTPTTEFSDDDNLRSDDSVLDELKSSKVEEAKQVSVPKALPDRSGTVDSSKSPRVFSNPTAPGRTPSKMQTLSIGRSVSSPFSENRPVSPVPAARKINVSSGISSRIRALEKISQPATPTTLNSPSATFESVKKRNSSLNTNSDAASVSRRSSFIPPSPASTSRAPTPSRSASVAGHSGAPRNESSEQSLHPSQPRPLASEPTVTNDSAFRPSPTDAAANAGAAQIAASTDRNNHISASLVPRPESGLSGSTHSSTHTSSTNHPNQSLDEKKESRTSRLFRRMSSMRPAPRKNVTNTLSRNQEESVPSAGGSAGASSKAAVSQTAVDVGEVNVQFPDTLLWKRRFMRIDETGCLVLLPANNKDFGSRNMTKRYPMSEFKTPCLPDEDRQELPNSILLDFLDGSTIQCACESRKGRNEVLQSECSVAAF